MFMFTCQMFFFPQSDKTQEFFFNLYLENHACLTSLSLLQYKKKSATIFE